MIKISPKAIDIDIFQAGNDLKKLITKVDNTIDNYNYRGVDSSLLVNIRAALELHYHELKTIARDNYNVTI